MSGRMMLGERQILEAVTPIECDRCGKVISEGSLIVLDTVVCPERTRVANKEGLIERVDREDQLVEPNRVLCVKCAGALGDVEPADVDGPVGDDDLDELVAQVHAQTKDDPEAVSYLKQRLEAETAANVALMEEDETLHARIEGMERDRAALRARISGLTRASEN